MLCPLAYFSLVLGLLSACAPPTKKDAPPIEEKTDNPSRQAMPSNAIEWEQLNPARGDQSPQAGTIWGDRKGTVATGFLAKFVDGFSSPPHIHNVTYRAVVLNGLVHNDDPDAEPMWMKPGSFWTQPAGESHITSAKGEEVIAYVEIGTGPYLVKPIDQAFNNGESPVNIAAENIVWLTDKQSSWIAPKSKAAISFLWESAQEPGLRGIFIRLSKGFHGTIESKGAQFRAILIQGNLDYRMPQADSMQALDPGSTFYSKGPALHPLICSDAHETLLYIRTDSALLVKESDSF
ncbi:MAG: DUF4437 domain-containing protein [Salibacteraceae bacterium]